jgi:hypothetical protein
MKRKGIINSHTWMRSDRPLFKIVWFSRWLIRRNHTRSRRLPPLRNTYYNDLWSTEPFGYIPWYSRWSTIAANFHRCRKADRYCRIRERVRVRESSR